MDPVDRLIYRTGFLRRKVLELIHEVNSVEGVDRAIVDDLYGVLDVIKRVEDRLYDYLA